jgi:hypothetical protein
VTIGAEVGTLVGVDGAEAVRRWGPKANGFQDEEGAMTGYPHNGPARRPADHGWVLTTWVLPLVVAIGLTIATAGFGAIFIAIALMIGLVSTVLHRLGHNE